MGISLILLFSTFVLCLLLLLWLRPSKRVGYWKKRGVPELDASFLATEMEVLLGKKDVTVRDDHLYNVMEQDNLPFCGVVESPCPIILLKDMNLVKKILIKDFDHFVDRRLFFEGARKDSVLRKMLGNLQGDEWKGVRSSVSPTFTTGKIKRMMDNINRICQAYMQQFNDKCAEKENNGRVTINVFNSVRQYTADVIASSVFGLRGDSVQNPNSEFYINACRLTDVSTFQAIKFLLSLRMPSVFHLFNIAILDMEALRFFEVLLKDKLQKRMKDYANTESDRKNNDFLQLLVEAKKSEQKRLASDDQSHQEFLTDHVMSGQCLSFFFAGYRTSSHFISFVFYVLAMHPEVQNKLRDEVAELFKKGENGEEVLDYESVADLVYMDMVFCEILRKYPPITRLERMCVQEYRDEETGLVVPKGTIVGVPLYSIHHDKQFYERPHDFYPEHFSPEKKAERSPYAFMPFGAGKRNCIGMRFALVESKAMLAHMVHNFIIEPSDKTPIPLYAHRTNMQIVPPNDLELTIIPRKRD